MLINNAGIMPLNLLTDEPDEIAKLQIDINLHGVIFGTKIAMADMIARNSGHIVNIASQAGKAGFPGGATYCATKHAVVGLSEAARGELRDTNVEVSCVMPAIVNTELGSGLHEARGVKTLEPEDVAEAIVEAIETNRFDVWVPKETVYIAGAMNLAAAPRPRGHRPHAQGRRHPLDAGPRCPRRLRGPCRAQPLGRGRRRRGGGRSRRGRRSREVTDGPRSSPAPQLPGCFSFGPSYSSSVCGLQLAAGAAPAVHAAADRGGRVALVAQLLRHLARALVVVREDEHRQLLPRERRLGRRREVVVLRDRGAGDVTRGRRVRVAGVDCPCLAARDHVARPLGVDLFIELRLLAVSLMPAPLLA